MKGTFRGCNFGIFMLCKFVWLLLMHFIEIILNWMGVFDVCLLNKMEIADVFSVIKLNTATKNNWNEQARAIAHYDNLFNVLCMIYAWYSHLSLCRYMAVLAKNAFFSSWHICVLFVCACVRALYIYPYYLSKCTNTECRKKALHVIRFISHIRC